MSHDTSLRGQVKYPRASAFQQELRRRVDDYFKTHGLSRHGGLAMWAKTMVISAWAIASYVLLLVWADSPWLAAPLAISLGLALAGIGFNVMHDGSHGSYSSKRWVNRLMALYLDAMGGSSYMWRWQHNVIHHTYTNIEGIDEDINVGFFARVAPAQRRLFFHRFQAFYLWLLYSFMPLRWWFFADFRALLLARMGGQAIPRPRGTELALFFAGKTLFFGLALALPLALHTPLTVALVFLGVAMVLGLTLSVVFQLAHCVEDADFPVVEKDDSRLPRPFSESQVETTVDFARGSRLVTWFLGGLNFQIEHHLFPKICHVHYPRLAPIVERTCREFGVRYNAHRSMVRAVWAHARWLHRMGRDVSRSAA